MRYASHADEHWAVLSVTRFLLALIVLSGHVFDAVGQAGDWTYAGRWFNQGSAVFGFLLLSGYSIAASVERTGNGFYTRRIFRIWPVYLLSVALSLYVTAAIGNAMPSASQLLASLLMLQNIALKPIAVDGQLWTLAVEWWLYMAAPWLNRMSGFRIALLAAGSLCADIAIRPGDASKAMYGESLLCLAWYWLAGFLYYRYRETALGYVVLLLPICCAVWGGVFLGRAVFLALLTLAGGWLLRVPTRLTGMMRWLGDLSYPIYCLHGPLLAWCVFRHVRSEFLICGVVLAASAVCLHFLDLPLRQWGVIYYRRRTERWTTSAADIANPG